MRHHCESTHAINRLLPSEEGQRSQTTFWKIVRLLNLTASLAERGIVEIQAYFSRVHPSTGKQKPENKSDKIHETKYFGPQYFSDVIRQMIKSQRRSRNNKVDYGS